MSKGKRLFVSGKSMPRKVYEVLAYVREVTIEGNGYKLAFEDVPDTTQVLRTFHSTDEAETWIHDRIE